MFVIYIARSKNINKNYIKRTRKKILEINKCSSEQNTDI